MVTESIDPFFAFKSCTILFSCAAATVAALPVVVVTFVAVVLLVDDDDDDDDDEIVLAIVLMIEAFLKRNVEPMEDELVAVAVAVGVTGVVAVGEFVVAVGSPLTKITSASDSTNKSHSTGSSFTMYRTMV